MNLDQPDDRSVAAGEYVLGTLQAQDRAAFDRVLAGDPALQAEVYAWQDRLVGLTQRVDAVEPDPRWWSQIEARLLPASTTAPLPATATAAATATATAKSAPSANDPQWRRLRIWQTVSGLAIAASLLLATLLVARMPAGTEPARYLAVLQAPDKSAGWIVEASVGGRLRLLPIGTSAAVPAGKALQFWTKAKSATGPTSLGLIRPGEVTDLPASRLPTLEADQLFELTLEPEHGSPIARPTGPVLFLGRTLQL